MTIEGRQHPDRDGQFRYIKAAERGSSWRPQYPVVSVDAKKKEQVGQYRRRKAANGGRKATR